MGQAMLYHVAAMNNSDTAPWLRYPMGLMDAQPVPYIGGLVIVYCYDRAPRLGTVHLHTAPTPALRAKLARQSCQANPRPIRVYQGGGIGKKPWSRGRTPIDNGSFEKSGNTLGLPRVTVWLSRGKRRYATVRSSWLFLHPFAKGAGLDRHQRRGRHRRRAWRSAD
jgi:hypothetical protein